MRLEISLLLATAALWAQPAQPSADELFQEAAAAVRANDSRKAEFWFLELRRLHPRDTRWGLGLIIAYGGENKFADALRIAREIQPQNQNDPLHFVRTGTLLLQLERPREALAEFQIALRLNPAPSLTQWIYELTGNACQALGDWEAAVDAYRHAKQISGKPSVPLALALPALGLYDEEIQEYRAILREDPLNPVALNNLAYALLEHGGNPQEALPMAVRAVGAAPGNAAFMDTLGWAQFKTGRVEEAETTLVKALLLEGGNIPTLREHLALVLDALQDWTPDRGELRRLLETAERPADIARMKVLLGALAPR